jgi:deoxyadenosine/deoxycytidine kinase
VATEPSQINPFLDKAYENPKEFTILAQMFFCAKRKLAQQNLPKKGIVFDRTVFEDKIFAQAHGRLGNMDDDHMILYETFYEANMGDLKVPEVYLRLMATPEQCLERIRIRGIKSEEAIELSYLQLLDSLYDDFWEDIAEKCVVIEVESTPNMDYQRLWKFIKNIDKKNPGKISFQC